MSVWFIHQAAPAWVLLTPGRRAAPRQLSLSLWAISGKSPKVRPVIQRSAPTRGSFPRVAFPCQKLISEYFPESCRSWPAAQEYRQTERGARSLGGMDFYSPAVFHITATPESCRGNHRVILVGRLVKGTLKLLDKVERNLSFELVSKLIFLFKKKTFTASPN